MPPASPEMLIPPRNPQAFRLRAIGLGVGLMVVASCSSEAAPSVEAEKPQIECIQEMTSDQRAQLIEFTDQLPASEKPNEDGTTDVCIVKQQPDGTTTEQHFKKDDKFGDYLLYSMMLGNGRQLATYGLISGDLDFGQAMALQLMSGVDDDGRLYRPYSYNQSTGWERKPTYQNVNVTNIQYGSNPPTSYVNVNDRNVPTGYNKPPVIPQANDTVAKVTKDNGGKKGVVKQVDSVKASDVLSGKTSPPAKTPNSLKPNAPVTTIKNPSNGGNSKSGSGGNKGPSSPPTVKTPTPKAPSPAPKSGGRR